MTLETPAAASKCPMLPLTEPNAQDCFFDICNSKDSSNASTSIGSPNLVPVPCASTRVILAGSIPNRW